MNRIRSILTLILILGSLLYPQIKRDARAVGMAGAYSTVADGIFTVGYNPALLAYQRDKPFMLQLAGFDLGVVGNYFSLSNLSDISGDTLNEREKENLFNNFLNTGGLRFYQDFNLPLPLLNYASGNMAITTNLVVLNRILVPTGIMRLLLYGNGNDPSLDMTLHYESMSINEIAFSFAVPFEGFAAGLSVKYLQGIHYLGVDRDSSRAFLTTTDEAMYGSGKYLIRHGIGGGGIGLDLGIVTQSINGWRAGFSIINAVGSISWNKPGFVKGLLAGKDDVYGNDDDLWHMTWGGEPLSDSSAVMYTYTIDSISATNLSNDSLFTSTNKIISNLDKDGKPIPFTTNYPAIFRAGLSYTGQNIIVSTDVFTGFEEELFARKKWNFCFGVEYLRFKSLPLRIGYSYGGQDRKDLSFGFGIHKGPLIFDMGFAFRNGMWIHSMKGLNISAGLVITSFKSRKTGGLDSDGPAPEPWIQAD